MIRRVDRAEDPAGQHHAEDLTIALTRTDLAALSNAVNNLEREVEDWEMHSVIGVTPDEARALQDAMIQILRATNWPNEPTNDDGA